jgi:hemerythrin superfamily protein
MKQQQAELTKPAVAPDAIALLIADHRKAKSLFDEYEKIKDKAGTQEKFDIAKTVCGDLLIHMAIEEAIFYPAAREAIDDKELLNEAEVEHDGAKELIRELGDIKPDDPMFDAHMKVLSEQIEHHVEEEEKDLFPKVRSAKLDIETLGQELYAAKQDMRQRLGLPAE